ncbi:MAG: DNA photolyase family protein [Gammaproteobacteria bacterium]|nr:DNA photolyase family protein [Gammaproteobacteria bacterium]NNJ72439.1 deoxyribodipyrimidine photo-lyase [Enterobacterales bacterium]
MTRPTAIVWFRQDLRLRDNPALLAAAAEFDILPIYIMDTSISQEHQPGGASRWWLHHSLVSLNDSLASKLQFFTGDPAEILQELTKSHGIRYVFWNRCYEPEVIARDKRIKSQLTEQDIEVTSFNGALLWEPMTVLKKDETPYRVFTPYYKKGCLNAVEPRYPENAPEQITYADISDTGVSLEQLNLLPTINWDSQIKQMWQPGENGAAERLSRYIREAATTYQKDRDIPSVQGTSKLSPHLHFGEVSPNQVWYAVKDAYRNKMSIDIEKYLAELGWREFSYYLLYHFPTLPTENFNKNFDRFEWQDDEALISAWQRGQTGIPIIDAGMRELWQTGYMHNRVRMVVGSFLVKNMLCHWHHGAAWFHDCLLDADVASNSASWQWVAGCGADAAPYFRIFNPILQGEKFDKEGLYVKQYCPELSALPKKYIHKPWEAPEEILKLANIKLGVDYPEPVVDLKGSRNRALEAFSALKKTA